MSDKPQVVAKDHEPSESDRHVPATGSTPNGEPTISCTCPWSATPEDGDISKEWDLHMWEVATSARSRSGVGSEGSGTDGSPVDVGPADRNSRPAVVVSLFEHREAAAGRPKGQDRGVQ